MHWATGGTSTKISKVKHGLASPCARNGVPGRALYADGWFALRDVVTPLSTPQVLKLYTMHHPEGLTVQNDNELCGGREEATGI